MYNITLLYFYFKLISINVAILSWNTGIANNCIKVFFLFVQDMHNIDRNYVKLYQLAQLTIEYLLVSLFSTLAVVICLTICSKLNGKILHS